jgi:hypothetical protein
MKAVITSIGEPTTDLCAKLMHKFGFDVEIMDEDIPWPQKFRKFIETHNEDCVRLDADCLPLPPVVRLLDWPTRAWIVQTEQVDLYSWNLKPGGPLLYRKCALDFIRQNIEEIDWRRPEATAWRLAEVNGRTETVRVLSCLHGFFQMPEDNKRSLAHRIDRRQLYESEIVEEITNLWNKVNLFKSSSGIPKNDGSLN